MGNATWSSATRSTYATRAQAAAGKSRDEIFQKRKMRKDFDPANITMRESVDSAENPESTAIIVGLDVTGSMGFIAEHIARQGLGTLVESIIDNKPVTDPHIMMMAIGDIGYDSAPLQVTQFEADIRIADQLEDLYLEGGGGGNRYESYDLPWIFAANKTHIDCFEKRGKKGYLFTIGDELPPVSASRRTLQETVGAEFQSDLTAMQHLSAAQEKFHVFHICVEQGHNGGQYHAWKDLLGSRAVRLSNYKHISEVITSVLQVSEGMGPIAAIEQWQDPTVRESVTYSLGHPEQ